MKKILTFVLLFVAVFGLVSCDRNDDKPNKTPDVTTEDVTTPEATTPEATTPEATTPGGLPDVDGVTFPNSVVTYDGKAQSIFCLNVPNGVTVTYEGNGQTELGTYTVTATLKYNNQVVKTLTATLTINPVLIDISGVTFADATFDYDGTPKEIKCLNVPEGVVVTYLYSGGNVEPGNHLVTATLVQNGIRLGELQAVLTINNAYVEPTPDITTPGGDYDRPYDTEIPATGYHLVINGMYYVPLEENGTALDPSFVEYYALGVEFEEGDIITLYNADAGESWAIETPDSYSSGVWVGSPDGIECGESGTFDVYVKMKFQADQIYFGYPQ